MIPAKELARIIARRGPRWWDRAIRRGTAILVLEVGGAICGYATVGPNRARNLRPEGRGLRDLHEAGVPGRRPRHAAVPRRAPRACPLRLRHGGGLGARRQRQRLPLLRATPAAARWRGRASASARSRSPRSPTPGAAPDRPSGQSPSGLFGSAAARSRSASSPGSPATRIVFRRCAAPRQRC